MGDSYRKLTLVTSDTSLFEGRDADECERFIRNITSEMLSQGRIADDAYIAQYAASRMSREALRWYLDQDVETKTSWIRLSTAMMRHYDQTDRLVTLNPLPTAETDGNPRSAKIPTPAAAPPLASVAAQAPAPPWETESAYFEPDRFHPEVGLAPFPDP